MDSEDPKALIESRTVLAAIATAAATTAASYGLARIGVADPEAQKQVVAGVSILGAAAVTWFRAQARRPIR